MSDSGDIQRRVSDIRSRAITSLVKNLILGFTGVGAIPALLQATEDIRGFTLELEAVKRDMDDGSITIPEVTITAGSDGTITIPEVTIEGDPEGTITIPEVVISDDE